MVVGDRKNRSDSRNCSECRSAIAHGHPPFGHPHATNLEGRCSFLLWTQEYKRYVATQAL